jgi:hypothetical protein
MQQAPPQLRMLIPLMPSLPARCTHWNLQLDESQPCHPQPSSAMGAWDPCAFPATHSSPLQCTGACPAGLGSG